MLRFLQTPQGAAIGQVVLWSAVLAVFLVCAYYVVLKFRDRAERDESGTSDLLSNFRELHERGTLSDTEYRTIKTQLGSTLQQELKVAGQKGPQDSSGTNG
jgi:uncharacterized membrane protein